MIPGLEARLCAALGSGGISLMPRAVPADMQDLIDTVSVDLLPAMTFVGRPKAVATAVRESVTKTGLALPLAEWLCSDVEDLATAFASVIGISLVGIQLAESVEYRSPHVAIGNLGHRLLTIYRGVGNEWLPPRVLAFVPPGWPLPRHIKGHRVPGFASLVGVAEDARLRQVAYDGSAKLNAARLCLSIDDTGFC